MALPNVIAAEVTPKPTKNAVTILDANGVKNLRIETEPVEERDFEETAFTLGRIEAIPRNIATLSSRIPGRVVELKAAPGDMVNAGDIIARIESRQPGDPPPVIPLKAPISGMVTRLDVHLGDPVDPDKTLLEITDLREVYAVARVPEYLAGRMKPGSVATPQPPAGATLAHITAAALPNERFDGTLLRFGTSADKESGTLDAVFRLTNNSDLLLRPGMRAEFSIVLGRRANVLSVPKMALQGEPANRYIYVKDFDLPNAFIKSPVVVGETNDRYVELLSGVMPADEVVTRGAYSLGFVGQGSMSLKEALDAAHGHEHAEDGSELTPAKKAEMEAKKRAASGKAADAHGHIHGDEEGGSPVWMYTSVVLFVLLLLSLAFRGQRNPETSAASPESRPLSGKAPGVAPAKSDSDNQKPSLTNAGGGH